MTNPDTDVLMIGACICSDESCPLCCAECVVVDERWN